MSKPGCSIQRSGGRRPWMLVPLLLAVACGEAAPEADLEPPPGAAPAPEAPPPPSEPQPPFFSPMGGPVGTDVEVWMDGLPAEATVMIGFGTVRGHQIIGETQVDDEGSLSTTVQVPSEVEENTSHYFFVADANQQPMSVSDAFHVTAPDGSLEVTAVVTDEGQACLALRGQEDELYTLEGDVPDLEPGDRVVVQGTAAHDSACEQGLTIAVEAVDVLE